LVKTIAAHHDLVNPHETQTHNSPALS